MSKREVPDPKEEPVEAAYNHLRNLRDEMSGELYDEHEEVREWAMDVEWAYTAVNEAREEEEKI